MIVFEKIATISLSLLVLRCNGSPLSSNSCRDGLRQLATCLLVDQQVRLGLLQHVNESWGDDHTFAINDALGCGIDGRAADPPNSVAGDAPLRLTPCVAASADAEA